MKRFFALALGAALVLSPAAQAKNDKHDGYGRDEYRHDGRGGPPGLAKKGGMPPGQAKKMWRRGQVLPATYWNRPTYYIEPARYRLRAPPPGYRWVMVDGDAYLVRTRSGLIADLVVGLLR